MTDDKTKQKAIEAAADIYGTFLDVIFVTRSIIHKIIQLDFLSQNMSH